MDHIAIMDHRQGLISKILTGEKNIESRWYKLRTAPWGRIAGGDTIYFKDTGKMVTARAEVWQVQQYDHPSEAELQQIIGRYGGVPGICGMMDEIAWLNWAKERPYVVLMFINQAQAIEPFAVNKSGFGSAAAWLMVQDIATIKIKRR